MPTVPKTQSVLPDITPTFQSAVGATPDAFGAGIGRATRGVGEALSQSGAVVDRIVQEEQLKDRTRKAKELEIQFRQQKRELLFGENGFYNKNGQNAIDAAPATKAAITQLTKTLVDSTTDNEVKTLFGLSATSLAESEFEAMDRTVIKARRDATVTVNNARIEEATQDAVASGGRDPKIVAQSLAIIRNSVLDVADVTGDGPEITQSNLEAAQTRLYREVTVGLIKQGATAEASAFFEKHQGQMDGPIAAEVSGLLRTANVNSEAIAVVDAIDVPGATRPEQRAALKTIKDPAVRLAAEQLLDNRLADQERDRRVQEGSIASEVIKFINEGGTFAKYQQQFPEKAALAAGIPNFIPTAYAAEDRRITGETYARVDDPKVLENMAQLSKQERVAFDLNTVRHMVTEATYKRLLDQQRGNSESLDLENKNYAVFKEGERLLSTFAPKVLKWDDKKQSKTQREIQQEIISEMNGWISTFTAQGTVPTQAEMQVKARGLLQTVETEIGFSGFFGVNSEVYVGALKSLTPKERESVTVDLSTINPEDVAGAKKAFTDRGIKPTDDLLEQLIGAEFTNNIARKRRLLGLPPKTSATVPLSDTRKQ